IDGNISTSFAEFKGARGVIWNDHETHAFELGNCAPVRVVTGEDDLFVLLLTDEAKGSAANGMGTQFTTAALGNDADGPFGKIPKQRGVGLFQMKDNGFVIASFNVIDKAIGCAFRTANFALQQRVECPLHIARSESLAIMKFNTLAKMKNIRERVWCFTVLGKTWLNIQMIVASEQSVKDKFINSLGLRVESHTRVKVRRAAFNHHDQYFGIRRFGAGNRCYKRRK